ncbi:MAG: hypothetical protein LBE01_04110 [Deltaproteobacteria bacterium]|jgi:hypothetical protein|nr:hypothetical protein [Deltaproteobacteria bacterium]
MNNSEATIYSSGAKISATRLLATLLFALCFSGCSESANSVDDKKSGEATIEMTEPVKSFLRTTLPNDYSFYALRSLLPVTMADLQANGIIIGSRVPDGLLPPNVIGTLYGGRFTPGTMLSLDDKSDGMDKFSGLTLQICIYITPDACVRNMPKTIALFSDEDAKKITNSEMVKVILK